MKTIFCVVFFFCFTSAMAQTERINFKPAEPYPEGVAYDAKNSVFYVSSVKTGSIGTVDAAGNYKLFYSDHDFKSSFGIKLDTKRNCIWFCVGDPNYSDFKDSATTFKKMGRVIAIDITTKNKMHDIDLTVLYNGKHFLNDLTLDDKGNIYVTDSYSPVIYKIGTDLKPAVFASNDMFKSVDIGLNGIVWHPAGYLLTVNNSNGSILKVDAADPSNVTKVKINNFFSGADGLLLDNQGQLVLVQNKGTNKIFKIKSSDNFNSATVVAYTQTDDRFQNPSTATIMNGKVYVMNAKLNELQDKTLAPSKEFSVQVAVFKNL